MTKRSKGAAFFEGSSWKHRVKILKPDGSIEYTKRGGFATQDEAEKSYKQYETTFQKAYRDRQMEQGLGADMGLKEYLEYWFENEFSSRIESTTRMVGSYTLYNLLLPHLEQEIKLRHLNSGYLDALLLAASKACPSAGNKSREFLNMALSDAVLHGYISKNPVKDTKPYSRPKPKVRILSKEKLKIFMEAAYHTNWYLEILLAVTCGLRKGEILALSFDSFDKNEMSVTITKQITSNPIVENGGFKIMEYGAVEKYPKTAESIRTIRVPQAVLNELVKRENVIKGDKIKFGSDYIDNGFISCQSNGMPHSLSAFNQALTRICERHSLPHITPHSLRHQYATILMENGVPIPKISALLGHKSVTTTYDYYCEVMDEEEHIIDFLNASFIP